MKVFKTVKLEMTDKETKALKTVYGMLCDLEWGEQRAVAYELGYSDLSPLRTDLATLYALGGGQEEDLK